MNTVNIIFIRYSYSKANVYFTKHRQNPTNDEYRDVELHNKWIILTHQVKNRIITSIHNKYKNIDIVITSPLKRCIEIKLILYNNK